MWIRPASAALLLLSLWACQQTKIADPTIITGGGPVAVVESRYVASGDARTAAGAGPVTYVLSKVELTNDQATALYPVIAHFSLTDLAGNRYFAIDTGASALVGISNDLRPLKPGEKRTFTIGFRADPTTMGTIRYDY